MRFDLNPWQRALLFASSAGIAAVAVYQVSRDGFDGIGWIVPTLVAVGLGFLALSSRKRVETENGDSESLDPEDEAQQIQAMSSASASVLKLIPNSHSADQALRDSVWVGRTVRSLMYGYTLVVVSCLRLKPDYLQSDAYGSLTEAMLKGIKMTWAIPRKRTLETLSPTELIAANEFTRSAADTAAILHLGTIEAMSKRQRLPFSRLYRGMEPGTKDSDEQLDKKYGPLTRQILEARTAGRN